MTEKTNDIVGLNPHKKRKRRATIIKIVLMNVVTAGVFLIIFSDDHLTFLLGMSLTILALLGIEKLRGSRL